MKISIKSQILALVVLCSLVGLADTIRLEGTGLTRTITVKAKDVVKIEAVENHLTLVGNGDLLHVDGSDNRIEVQGGLNGIVVTGSGNQITVRGGLGQLDVRGCDNQLLLEGDCKLIQYGGSDNVTRWKQKTGSKPPKVERMGWNNLFEVISP